MTKPDITIESIVEGVARVTQTDRALVSQITWAFAKSANITEAQLIALARGEACVVPVEPTEAMITAGYTAGYEKLHPYAGAPAWANACYRAMLAAAEKEKGG